MSTEAILLCCTMASSSKDGCEEDPGVVEVLRKLEATFVGGGRALAGVLGLEAVAVLRVLESRKRKMMRRLYGWGSYGLV